MLKSIHPEILYKEAEIRLELSFSGLKYFTTLPNYHAPKSTVFALSKLVLSYGLRLKIIDFGSAEAL